MKKYLNKDKSAYMGVVLLVLYAVFFVLVWSLILTPFDKTIISKNLNDYYYIGKHCKMAREIATEKIKDEYGKEAKNIFWDADMKNIISDWTGGYIFDMEVEGEIYSVHVTEEEIDAYRENNKDH